MPSRRQHHHSSNKVYSSSFPSLLQRFLFRFFISIHLPSLLTHQPTSPPTATMKFTTTSLLSTSFLLATASAAPSPGTAYQLRVHSVSTPPNAALNNTLLTVKDESATSNPTPLGVFSTGEPRNAYTFTFSGNSDAYEAKGTKKQTHLFLTGNPVAMALYDVPIGSDPKPGQNETQVKSFIAQTPFGASGDQFFPTNQGAGTWRACKGDSTVDYTIYFFDGKSPGIRLY